MKNITVIQRFNIIFLYCLPALLAFGLLSYLLYERVVGVNDNIRETSALQCESVQNLDQESIKPEDLRLFNICKYHQNFNCDDNNEVSKRCLTFEPKKKLITNGSPDKCLPQICTDIDQKLEHILLYNSLVVFVMTLLPFVLIGDLLSKSQRIHLSFQQRTARANSNWWLKFIVALIMAFGWIYIINPLGRGASIYQQFFIAAGLVTENTLPIYIKTEVMTPVLAGFFGWYLHMIGYTFTKLVHHDVISSRVYNLLFNKFIVTYGIAMVVPQSDLLGDPKNAAFFMFLIGLFPLSAMSMLIEAVSKISSNARSGNGNLSQLPGIARWQILRLEEEGVDSLASLANLRPSTINENLFVIRRLTLFWVDVAQLYTIVGHDGYQNLKVHCQTASEFLRNSKKESFIEEIHNIEKVGEAEEISRLIETTFRGKLIPSSDLVLLPEIASWQISLLESSSIHSIYQLANTNSNNLPANLTLIDYQLSQWVDIAQLYTIIGDKNYSKLKGRCDTASEFIEKTKNPNFNKYLKTLGFSSSAHDIQQRLMQAFPKAIHTIENPRNGGRDEQEITADEK